MFCVQCASYKPEDAIFCNKCGKELINNDAATEQLLHIKNTNTEQKANKETPFLVAQSKNTESVIYTIIKNPTTIGRMGNSDLFLDDVTVSRKHGEIFQENGKWYIKDNGSLNGTYINKILEKSCELKNNDIVQIGKYKFLYKTSLIQ